MPTYARADVVFERGEGCLSLTPPTAASYLDFASGIAVNALGHAHPQLIEALTEQAGKLWHTPTSSASRDSSVCRAAGRQHFADTVFFTNSGAEASRRDQGGAASTSTHTGIPNAGG